MGAVARSRGCGLPGCRVHPHVKCLLRLVVRKGEPGNLASGQPGNPIPTARPRNRLTARPQILPISRCNCGSSEAPIATLMMSATMKGCTPPSQAALGPAKTASQDQPPR